MHRHVQIDTTWIVQRASPCSRSTSSVEGWNGLLPPAAASAPSHCAAITCLCVLPAGCMLRPTSVAAPIRPRRYTSIVMQPFHTWVRWRRRENPLRNAVSITRCRRRRSSSMDTSTICTTPSPSPSSRQALLGRAGGIQWTGAPCHVQLLHVCEHTRVHMRACPCVRAARARAIRPL